MYPEDQLDALLTQRAATSGITSTEPRAVDAELEPLLEAADRLTSFHTAVPSEAFAQGLETRLLAHAATLATHENGARPVAEFAPRADRASTGRTVRFAGQASDQPGRARRLPQRYPRVLWQAVAAAVILVIGVGALSTAAAFADPASLLFGLHRLEQAVRVDLSGSAAARTRLHIQYANEALSALDTIVAQHNGNHGYGNALEALRDEAGAASTELQSVPAGADHDALAAQLSNLQSRARHDLHAALGDVGWEDRVATSSALGEFGATVPHVASVSVVTQEATGTHEWQVLVSGNGFEAGAVLMVNGQVEGTVVSVTPNLLVGRIPASDSGEAPASIGVSNPDGTAAATSNIQLRGHISGDGLPGAAATPGKNDHSGDTSGGRSGGHTGTHPATPTPSSTPGEH